MKKIVIITTIFMVLSTISQPLLVSKTYANSNEEDINKIEIDDKIKEHFSKENLDETNLFEEVEKNNESSCSENENEEEADLENQSSIEPPISDEPSNQFGIKPGTIVYGEDISELSEEELQYVPEGWRDGVIESEHPYEKNEVAPSPFSSYPNVNNYIKNNKFKAAKVEYDYKDFFTKFNYRNGYGQVEGVVAHETANNKSTILSEIAYMSRNHKNAFVHAFVDGKRVIEIHPTNLGAWGAGRFGNQRFIHVELVRVHNFDDFARSINNYANYIANKLYDYNLGVTSAEKSGKGSLWSHRAVSNHLGGTNHVDPHGYFAKYGYNFDDFVKLVTEKHNALVGSKKANTSKLGHLQFNNVRIYKNPTNLNDHMTTSGNYTNEVFYIKSETMINGKVYYLISREPSSKQGVVGWVQDSDISVNNHEGIDKKRKEFIINNPGKAYNKAWGGSKNIVFDLSSFVGETFVVNLTEKVGDNTWHRGTLNGKTVWINSQYLSTKIEKHVSKLGHIRNSNINIYENIYENSIPFKAGSEYTNAVYYIKKETKFNGKLFYLISISPSSTKGVIGWVEANDLSVREHKGMSKKSVNLTIKGNGNAYGKAWGGSKDLIYNLSSYEGNTFKVNLIETVGENIWVRGILGEKQVWIHSSYLIDEENTSRLGHIRNGDVTIYSSLYVSGIPFKANKEYKNAVYYIKKQAHFKGELYYLLSIKPSSKEGIVGWIKAKDLSVRSHTGVDKNHKVFYFTGKGKAYSKAWGGSKDLVYNDMSKFKGQRLDVHLTEKIGDNTWYRGNFNGKTIWLHSSYLTTPTESKISLLGHLRANRKIYKQIGDEKSTFDANPYTNAVYYIKKQAILNSETFYLISTQPSSKSGVMGWVNLRDLSVHSHVGVNKKKKTYIINGNGKAYSKAWGGSKDLIYSDLNQYKGQPFYVHLTEKVGGNTWYRGKLQGKTIWLHGSYVK